MSKDITYKLLTEEGFIDDGTNVLTFKKDDNIIDIYINTKGVKGRQWTCVVYTGNLKYVIREKLTVDIQTIDQLNSLMNLIGVNFKIKEN